MKLFKHKSSSKIDFSPLEQVVHSIRTRYSLVTAFFLLLILVMFYIGGRIVLVHLVRDTERQVQSVGHTVNLFVQQDTRRMQNAARKVVESLASREKISTDALIGSFDGIQVELALLLDREGKVVSGHRVDVKEKDRRMEKVGADDLATYAATFVRWTRATESTNSVHSAGIISLKGKAYHSAIIRIGSQFAVLGTSFSVNNFTVRMNESLGQTLRLTAAIVPSMKGRSAIGATAVRSHPVHSQPVSFNYGIIPMISEAMSYYSGGFWRFDGDPFEAEFTLRDIVGSPVAHITVSMPKSFAMVTASAMNRLTFCIAIIGLLFILPIYWMQCRVLLNPLSAMTRRIQEVAENRFEEDCPRIEWKGRDEFALLAVSVNRLLEAISRRSIDVRQSAKRQQALIDGIPDGLMVFGGNSRLVTIFKQPEGVEPIPGLVEQQALVASVWGEENVRRFESALSQTFADNRRHGVQLVIDTGEGSAAPLQRNFDVRVIPMDSHFALVVIRDITEEATAEQRRFTKLKRDSYHHKQESIATFAAGIAHDVRNILGIVLNTAENTWRKDQSKVNREILGTMRAAVRRGCDMMRELTAFADETDMVLKPTDPAVFINGSKSLLQAAAGQRIQLEFDIPTDLPKVDADHTRMWKAFFNLVKNAAESLGDSPGVIRISAMPFDMLESAAGSFTSARTLQPGPGVLFSVVDNGPGIPKEVLGRIFDPYISTKGAGRGLGLSIAYATISAHGGGIRVSSSAGYGATFEIFLPVSHVQTVNEPVATGGPQPELQLSDAKRSVLIVDDEASVLATTGKLLGFLKLDAIGAGDRHTALLKFRRNASSLACVLLDAHLESINTARIARIMRRIAPAVPIILTSGSSESELSQFFEPALYDTFLAKPYTLEEFRCALAQIQLRATGPAEKNAELKC